MTVGGAMTRLLALATLALIGYIGAAWWAGRLLDCHPEPEVLFV